MFNQIIIHYTNDCESVHQFEFHSKKWWKSYLDRHVAKYLDVDHFVLINTNTGAEEVIWW